jgi:hypothetical protein
LGEARIGERPTDEYIASNSGDIAFKHLSATSFTRRSGWFAGTRFSGVKRLSMLACFVSVPRMPSTLSGGFSGVDPLDRLFQHPANTTWSDNLT